MKILFIAARFPDPLLRGFQVRAFHQLRILGRRHEITLIAFTDRPPSGLAEQQVATFCRQVITVPLRPAGMLAGLLRGVGTQRPLQTMVFDTPEMRRAVGESLHTVQFDVVHLQLTRLASHLEADVGVPRVLDLVDALSLNMARRRALERGPLAWLAGVEATRLQAYERHLCGTFEHATVVSEIDRRAIGDFPGLTVNQNGVDLERLPFANGERATGEIVLTGNMSYFPNVDGSRWFAHEVLPQVSRSIPSARFTIVGATPSGTVRRLATPDGRIAVRGFVPSLHPFLARAQVAVAPLRAGSGQPLKVLEAMASGAPVVATPMAVAGLDVEPERHLLVGEGSAEMAAQVVRVMRDGDLARRLAREARRLVEERYSWERSVSELEGIYESARRGQRGDPGRQHAPAAVGGEADPAELGTGTGRTETTRFESRGVAHR